MADLLQATPVDPDAYTVAGLLKANHTVPEIALLLGKSLGSVRDLAGQAQALLSAGAIQAVSDWLYASQQAAKRGNHKPARDLLVASKVIDPPYSTAAPPSPGPAITVQLGFALPGLPLVTSTPALPDEARPSHALPLPTVLSTSTTTTHGQD